MVPRPSLPRHLRLRVLRHFGARGATHVRDLVDRLKISRSTLHAILGHERRSETVSEDEARDSSSSSSEASPPGGYSGGAPGRRRPSREELALALTVLRRVVECRNDLPRWFTYVFDRLFPGALPSEPPPRGGGDVLDALAAVCRAFGAFREPPAWFCSSVGRALRDRGSPPLRRASSAPSLLSPDDDDDHHRL